MADVEAGTPRPCSSSMTPSVTGWGRAYEAEQQRKNSTLATTDHVGRLARPEPPTESKGREGEGERYRFRSDAHLARRYHLDNDPEHL